jgi:hypothetical protein
MQENKKIRACTFQQEILVNIEEKLSIFHVQRKNNLNFVNVWEKISGSTCNKLIYFLH